MKPKRIASVIALTKLSQDKDFDCYIQLCFNLISVKTIRFASRSDKFLVTHHIDGTVVSYTLQELIHHSNIGLAIAKGALYYKVL